MKTNPDRFETLSVMALELNSTLPTDVMLKGDGSIWVTTHGNSGTHARKLAQHEVLSLLHTAIQMGNRMISV